MTFDLNQVLKDGEGERVEFKTSFNSDVIESLVAFANTNGGTVYIGITDSGDIKGINLSPENIPGWINEIKCKTIPSVIPDYQIYKADNKTVLSLSTKEFPIKPVSTRGRYYKRAANSNLISDNYVSTPGNKLVADLFKESGLIEKYGTGIKRIIEAIDKAGLPAPEFKEISDGLKVTIFSQDYKPSAPDETVEKILAFIRENPSITQKELAVLTGLSQRGIEWNLRKMKNDNLIERTGPAKSGNGL